MAPWEQRWEDRYEAFFFFQVQRLVLFPHQSGFLWFCSPKHVTRHSSARQHNHRETFSAQSENEQQACVMASVKKKPPKQTNQWFQLSLEAWKIYLFVHLSGERERRGKTPENAQKVGYFSLCRTKGFILQQIKTQELLNRLCSATCCTNRWCKNKNKKLNKHNLIWGSSTTL